MIVDEPKTAVSACTIDTPKVEQSVPLSASVEASKFGRNYCTVRYNANLYYLLFCLTISYFCKIYTSSIVFIFLYVIQRTTRRHFL